MFSRALRTGSSQRLETRWDKETLIGATEPDRDPDSLQIAVAITNVHQSVVACHLQTVKIFVYSVAMQRAAVPLSQTRGSSAPVRHGYKRNYWCKGDDFIRCQPMRDAL